METQTVSTSQVLPRLAYSLAEAESLCGLSRSSIYRLIAAGHLKTVHLGRRRLVPVDEITKLLAGESFSPRLGADRQLQSAGGC